MQECVSYNFFNYEFGQEAEQQGPFERKDIQNGGRREEEDGILGL